MNLSFDTQILASTFEYLPSCHSTNDIMLDKIKNGNVSEGHLVLTFNQTKGRGQRGNTWEAAPHKNLTFTVYLKSPYSLHQQFDFNMMISVALREAMQAFTSHEVKIKWPNDIYILKDVWRKVGGMLIENQISGDQVKSSVVGIGVNINQEEFGVDNATSLKNVTEKEFDLIQVLNSLLLSLERWYVKRDHERGAIREYYTKNLLFYGETHKFEDERGRFEGTVLGVSPAGELVLRMGDHVENFEIKGIKYIF